MVIAKLESIYFFAAERKSSLGDVSLSREPIKIVWSSLLKIMLSGSCFIKSIFPLYLKVKSCRHMMRYRRDGMIRVLGRKLFW